MRPLINTARLTSLIMAFLLLLALSGCGFTPIYAKTSHSANSNEFLASIDVAPINSITGAEFYNHLLNLFPYSSDKKYLLKTEIALSKENSVIEETSDVVRATVNLNVNYTLTEKETGKIITAGSFLRLSSFNTTFSPYSNTVLQGQVENNLAMMAAEEVRNRIMLFNQTKLKNHEALQQ